MYGKRRRNRLNEGVSHDFNIGDRVVFRDDITEQCNVKRWLVGNNLLPFTTRKMDWLAGATGTVTKLGDDGVVYVKLDDDDVLKKGPHLHLRDGSVMIDPNALERPSASSMYGRRRRTNEIKGFDDYTQ